MRNMFRCNILNQVDKKFIIFLDLVSYCRFGFRGRLKTDSICFLEIEMALVRHNCRCDCCMDTGTLEINTPFLHKLPIV